MKKLTSIFLILGFITFSANAALISVSEQADITTDGQGFLFEFTDLLGSNDSVGTLIFSASGDFENNGANENVVVSLGSFGSFLMNSTGLLNNNLVGLSLSSFTSNEVLQYYDTTFEAVFDVSSDLMTSLVSTGTLDVDIQNGIGVNSFFQRGRAGTDEDYVSFNLSYNSATLNAVAVSSSSPTIILLMSCIMLFGCSRRR
jgi:hypothetical protein